MCYKTHNDFIKIYGAPLGATFKEEIPQRFYIFVIRPLILLLEYDKYFSYLKRILSIHASLKK